MKQDYIITIDTMGKEKGEQFINRLKKLKPKFDKLSYLEKLKFWEDNDLELTVSTYFFTEGENRNKPENHITIFPEKGNYEYYFDWYFKHIKIFKPLQFDLEKIKEHYYEIIKDNLQAFRYTADEYLIYRKRFFNHYDRDVRFLSHSYRKGVNSYLKKEKIILDENDFIFQCLDYLLYGKIDAEIIPFLDRQMDLMRQEKENPKQKVEEEEIIPDEIQQRIVWLYSIGIIDYIKEKHKTHSPSTIGKILSKGTGVKWNTIKKTIERIESENLLEKYSDYINNTCQQLKITRVK